MLYKVITSREAFVAHPGTILDRAWEVGRANTVNGCLVSLKIGKACEIGCRSAVGQLAFPRSEHTLALQLSIGI